MININTIEKKIKNKKIAILGLGIENQELLNFLFSQNIKTEITICDFRNKEELDERFLKIEKENLKNKSITLNWQLGFIDFNKNLDPFDYLLRSPGWSLKCPGIKNAKEKNKNIKVESAMNWFFELAATNNIIGVTGTKGKGTTSSLIYEILKEDKRDVYIGGNIGVAPFSFIENLSSASWIVLELSSFQLEDLKYSPRFAVFTNFSPEHLSPADPNNPNFHNNLEEYWQAKLNICKFQNKNNFLIANNTLKEDLKQENIKSKIYFFKKSELKSPLLGEHNKENISAAEILTHILKIKQEKVIKAVKNFKGLEHRLEFVAEKNNIKYYNDTFATTPEATITALKSFHDKKIILIAGGADKGSDFSELINHIKGNVKKLVLLPGKGSNHIKNLIENKSILIAVNNMSEAVDIAKKEASDNNIVLLSPACASFGIFKNYKERGKLFKELVL